MDGLTVSTSESLLNTGQTLKQIGRSRIENEVNAPFTEKTDRSFADTLKAAFNSVNQAQHDSDQKMQDLSTGKNHNIAEVMIAAEKADISLKLLVQVRNKIIEAYQEIMKMQV